MENNYYILSYRKCVYFSSVECIGSQAARLRLLMATGRCKACAHRPFGGAQIGMRAHTTHAANCTASSNAPADADTTADHFGHGGIRIRC